MWQFDSGSYPGNWNEVDAPVNVALRDAAQTENGPCAVGAKGKVIGRTDAGEWGVLVENGPGGYNHKLHVVDATDDGKRIWFGGAGGAFGCYDLVSGEREDYSDPETLSGTVGALTVAGERGDEKLLVADSSGNVCPAYVKPDEDDCGTTLDWEFASRPSGDTAVKALASGADGVGYALDNNANVFQTGEDGWVKVGVADSDNSMYAGYVDGDVVLVGGGNGFVYERECDGRWTPHDVGPFTVRALTREDDEMLAGGSGHIVYREGNGDWVDVGWDGGSAILGVLVGTDGHADVAVGKGGTIVEGHRQESGDQQSDSDQ